MSPEESPPRPSHGRSPHMRRPLSMDGVLPSAAPPNSRPASGDFAAAPPAQLTPSRSRPGPPIRDMSFTRPLPRPAAAPNPVSPPTQTLPPPTQTSSPAATSTLAPNPAPVPQQFTPPVAQKRKKPLLKRLAHWGMGLLVLAAIVFGVVGYFRAQARQNNPVVAFDDALHAILSVNQLEADFFSPKSSRQVKYDFSNPTNPIISSRASLELEGSRFGLQAYGSAQNTYVSYQTLPKTVSGGLAQALPGAWVQLRNKGTAFAGVNSQLANLADPRYQAFGPIIMGNYSIQAQSQLIQFIHEHKVYDYNPTTVTSESFEGKQVFVYHVNVNNNFLKLANQSVATNNKFSPNDVQAAVNDLDKLKGAKLTFYITAKTHYLAKVEINTPNQQSLITFSHYNTMTLPGEPQTKLTWSDFSLKQWQLEAQLAAQQPAAQTDAQRKSQLDELHQRLAAFFVQSNAYPSVAELNNQSWVAAHLGGVAPETFRDPLATSLQLADTPKANTLAYQPVTADGKAGCDDSLVNGCAHYALSVILSNGQRYSVSDP